MPHFEDLTPYRYVPGSGAALNVGWLSGAHPYPTGDVPPGLVERLGRLAVRHLENQTMGWQHCELCGSTDVPVEVEVDGVSHPVGDAEVWVRGDGQTYAAPTLVVHYVAAHGYRPPAGFVAAVLRDPRADPS